MGIGEILSKVKSTEFCVFFHSTQSKFCIHLIMMVFVKRYMLLALLFKVNCLFSQDITGTWEGDMNQFEFLQLNIVQVGDNLCGYG